MNFSVYTPPTRRYKGHMDFEMNVTPWAHQREDFVSSRDLPGASFPWEPRCGKSKVMVDTIAYHAAAGRVNTALVTAPCGIHVDWAETHIAKHWPAKWPKPFVVVWDSGKATTKRFQARLDEALKTEQFVWVLVNVEALVSPKLVNRTKRGGPGFLEKLVAKRKCFLVCDESIDLSTPSAQRTRAVLKLVPKCIYRRILDGTMSDRGPFGLYSQYKIVAPDLFVPRYTTFKARYGVFQRVRYGAGPSFDQLVEYRNLDELNQRIAPYTFPRRKSDCFDLPERVHGERTFVMPKEHRRIYDELRDELIAQLDNGETITAQHALTNMLRLQQISRGHVENHRLEPDTPALDAVSRLVRGQRAIVWCRFTLDVDAVCARLRADGLDVIRCDGSTPPAERPDLQNKFNEGAADAWVGTTGTGSRGLDLPAANLMVFYSHGFKLVQRNQALERNYGSNQKAVRCDVVDLVAADTIDRKALDRLAAGQDLANQLTGRDLKEMLT